MLDVPDLGLWALDFFPVPGEYNRNFFEIEMARTRFRI
jgi:hypothetical protein